MNNPSCIAEGCNKQIFVKKRGLCVTHYQYWRSFGDVPGVPRRADASEPCVFDGCVQERRYGELCMGHYNQRRKGRKLVPLRRYTDPSVRDEAGNKQCRRCERWLETGDFSINKARPDGLSAYCRRCERDKMLIHKYGITVEQHEAMLADQGGGCAICGGPTKDGREFYVDHDHTCCSGERTCGNCVRGLLCGECNLGIGYLGDDAIRMERAIAYLRGANQARGGGLNDSIPA